MSEDTREPRRRPDLVEPHYYIPSWMHMGDCAICGHVAEAAHHLRYKPQPVDRDLFGRPR